MTTFINESEVVFQCSIGLRIDNEFNYLEFINRINELTQHNNMELSIFNIINDNSSYIIRIQCIHGESLYYIFVTVRTINSSIDTSINTSSQNTVPIQNYQLINIDYSQYEDFTEEPWFLNFYFTFEEYIGQFI